MASSEEIEKVRQEIMRFRELLDVMRERLEGGERAYARLFASLSPEDIANRNAKEVQWKLAEHMVADVSPLRRAVGTLHFDARDLERNFQQLLDIIATNPVSD